MRGSGRLIVRAPKVHDTALYRIANEIRAQGFDVDVEFTPSLVAEQDTDERESQTIAAGDVGVMPGEVLTEKKSSKKSAPQS